MVDKSPFLQIKCSDRHTQFHHILELLIGEMGILKYVLFKMFLKCPHDKKF